MLSSLGPLPSPAHNDLVLTHQHHGHCHHCLRSKTYAISPFARHIAAINVIVIICGYAPIELSVVKKWGVKAVKAVILHCTPF